MLAGEDVGESDRAARRPALDETCLWPVEMEMPRRRRVPMEVRAGAALSEQQVEHLSGLVLTPAIKRREHLP